MEPTTKTEKKTIIQQKKRLEETMTSPTKNEELISEINAKLKQAYNADEEFWRQRSRTLWLALGDKNSGDRGVEPSDSGE